MNFEPAWSAKKIGELLLESGAISEGQLEFGLQYQERETEFDRGVRLGELLMKHDCVDRVSLKVALKKQVSPPPPSTASTEILRQFTFKDPHMRILLPPRAMIRYVVFPLVFRETRLFRKLIVLAENGEDRRAHEEISFLTGCIIASLPFERVQLFELIERTFFAKA
jgi:hypothetical protein